MCRVLVTGGAGFIGSHLVQRLLRDGHRVICIDNLSTGVGGLGYLGPNRESLRLVQADINSDDLRYLFDSERFDWIFHYAAVVGVKRTLSAPLQVLRDIDGARRILDLARAYQVKRVIYASSSEVYGHTTVQPLREDGPVDPRHPYGVVKLVNEHLMRAYYETHGVPTCSLRFFNVYGPHQNSSAYGFVVGIFIHQVLGGRSPTIFGDGLQTRDFTFIDENVEAAVRAAVTDGAVGKVINVGTGHRTTVRELAEQIIALCAYGGKMTPTWQPARPNEIQHRCADVHKMTEILGFRASIPLQEGLRRTIAAYRFELSSPTQQ